MVGQEGRHARIDDERDIAATTAVAPIGTAERLELLAANGRAAVATIASSGVEGDTINEGRHGES